MLDNLKSAKNLVEEIRFSGDLPNSIEQTVPLNMASLRASLFQTELQVSEQVTPEIYKALTNVLERLKIPKKAVRTFIYPSSDFQAMCYVGDDEACIIRIASNLIHLLETDELEFVFGHELGHFLLNHSQGALNENELSHEKYKQKRAQEISVDRIGLIACKSLNTAIRAMMKSVSGLNNDYIRFDVGDFLSQLQQGGEVQDFRHATLSHPSMLVRCRALLWFSLVEHSTSGYHNNVTTLSQLDFQVENDLAMYIDGPFNKLIEDIKHDMEMWVVMLQIIESGLFSKEAQIKVSERFGEEKLNKLKKYMSDSPTDTLKVSVTRKIEEASTRLRLLIPNSYENEVSYLINNRFL